MSEVVKRSVNSCSRKFLSLYKYLHRVSELLLQEAREAIVQTAKLLGVSGMLNFICVATTRISKSV
jgi:hypothetical protein